jgi:hypothetical protein
MSDLRDFTGKNRKFTGTIGERVSVGTTVQRVDTQGTIRFNSTTNLMEYYTGIDWKSIDAPPIVTAFNIDGGSDVTSAVIDPTTSSNLTIEVKGSLFDTTGATVTFEPTSGSTVSALTITRDSGNLLTVTVASSDFVNANEPYSIKVTNGSGLAATLSDCLVVDSAVVFTNAADTNYDIFDSIRSSGTIAAADLCGATDADGDTITYSVSAGALPSGCTLNLSTGDITWSSVSAVGSDTVSTFSISAATTDLTITRQFTITVKAPVVESFTATGSDTFTVPTGVTSVDVLVVAGGGRGSGPHGGGGGAGGLIYRPGFPVTPGGSVSYTVGAGGTSVGIEPQGGQPGSDSVFGTLTAKGGGGGNSNEIGRPGGSGSGGSCYVPGSKHIGGSANQPGQPGDSGTYGFGNPGGNGSYNGSPPQGAQGGSGGGAGASGGTSSQNTNGPGGGAGRAYSISGSSVYYAGGGGNGSHTNVNNAGPGGIGGGGGGTGEGASGQPGTANRGGGGGGTSDGPSPGGNGGSGVIIVTY